MLRGVLSLTPAQSKALLSELHGQIKGDQLLLDRIALLANSTAESGQLQLSEDEAELLLDLLPAPQTIDDPNLATARQVLQQFLTHLKWPSIQ